MLTVFSYVGEGPPQLYKHSLLNCRQEGLVGGTKSNDNKKVFLEKGIRDHRCLKEKKGKNTFKDGLVFILLWAFLRGFCCFVLFF